MNTIRIKWVEKVVKGFLPFYLFALLPLMAQAQESGDSLVNVAFGQQAKYDVLGGISTVNVSELLKKDYYTYSLGELSGLVGGYNGNVWGQGALILVDGSPREASYVNASQIESVTVMKAASAVALYGSKGAKGVILITTKRGKVQPLSIDVRANTGFYVAKRYPKYLGAAEYMTLYNEAYANDGHTTPYYDAATIYNTAAGTNPYRYPDMDLYSSEYISKAYNRTDVTGEITGGTERARYYANFGMNYTGSPVKYGDKTNDNDLNFNVRANVDMNITSWLKGFTNAAVNLENNYRGRGDFWAAAANLRPNWYSPLLPIDMMDMQNLAIRTAVENSNNVIDGLYLLGGNNANQTTVYGDMLKAGYIKGRNRTFMFDVGVQADLSAITKGLTFSTTFSIDYWNNYNEAWKVDYATYQPQWANMNGKDIIIGLTQYGEDKNSTNEYVGQSYDTQTMTARAQLDYQRTFGGVHNVAATLVGWGYQQQASRDSGHASSDYHRVSNLNLGLRADYNYAQKYYVEAAASLVHSAKLAEGHREALSPSVALGWRISKEKFMENVSFVDDLKLTAAYSVLNQDIDLSSWYMYKGSYNVKGTWYTWEDGSEGGFANTSIRGANDDLGFIKRKEWRIGLDGQFSVGGLGFRVDLNYFNQRTTGLITDGGSTIYPSFFTGIGSFLPNTNFNEDQRSGFDFDVKLNKTVGQVDASLGLVGMLYASEAKVRDEVWSDSYQYRAGHSLDAAWGYECEGFFADQADIDSHAKQTFGEVRPGDLKYKDMNNDGVIDSKDQVDLGHYSPTFFYGLNLTLKWKNFTFFALATGQAGGIGFKNSGYYWLSGSSKYSEVARGRWTSETAATATYPRLTTTSNSNNLRNSSFWKYSTNRFDLSKIQVTYDMPQEWFAGKVVKGLSVYVSGESLLTLSGERELMETNIGSAPQCRFYNLGVKVNL